MKSFIKVVLTLFILSSLGLSTSKLESKKEKIVDRIDKKIELLTQFKSCVLSAKDRDELRECRTKHKTALKDLKATQKTSKK